MSYRRLGATALALCSVAALATGCSDDESAETEGEVIDCEVAIVGGGAGGLHTAYRLGPSLGAGVCLFEKESKLGGRILDVALDDSDPNAPRVGAGARRIMETQDVLFALASELGLTLESTPNPADLINARGLFSFSKDDLHARGYPLIPADPDPEADLETWLYDQLRKGPERANAGRYPDFRAYVRNTLGSEQYQFLHDMSRFRADFEYPLDARGYLDYLDEEWDVCCTPSYPVGGMSTFISGMERRASEAGVRIFTAEPVSEIRRAPGGYALRTAKRSVSAKKVVIAVPPVALDFITGDVVDALKATSHFRELIAVRVVTITQWWPEDWWSSVKNPALTENNQVWRAWTTEHCINFIEIPINADAARGKVTRTVYDDDAQCVAFWEETAKVSIAAVEAEIKVGLEHLFNGNGVSTPDRVTIPDPLKTHVQIWPAAWHWLRAGTTHTNAEIFDWAVEPLPGEEVALVGEAYNPQRSGWSDGAYKSSIHLLNKRYGMSLPGLRTSGLRAAVRPKSPHTRAALKH